MARKPDTLAPTLRQHEGLRRCQACGGVVVRDKQGKVVTPLLGNRHNCEAWKEVLAHALTQGTETRDAEPPAHTDGPAQTPDR